MKNYKAHQHPEQANLFETESINNGKNVGLLFTTNLNEVREGIAKINPSKYAKSRNFINGSVTYLSPYISRGCISLTEVKEEILGKYKFYEAEKLIQELAWREFFQRVWQSLGEGILRDVKQTQPNVSHYKIPTNIINANTGIDALDKGINNLYETGYMHNHLRMYTAMLTCNVAQAHWQAPAEWLYYHLLDGDVASNALSWQWVAGSFSSKKYYANQENISKYTGSNQYKSYLANSYEAIAEMPIPDKLTATQNLALTTNLPTSDEISWGNYSNLAIFNSYNLDATWHNEQDCLRVLLLEPSHFTKHPISDKVLAFIIDLAKNNIKDVKIYVGEFATLTSGFLTEVPSAKIYFKEHPTTKHYHGIQESREWLFPEVQGNFNSFFSFWKKCERYIK